MCFSGRKTALIRRHITTETVTCQVLSRHLTLRPCFGVCGRLKAMDLITYLLLEHIMHNRKVSHQNDPDCQTKQQQHKQQQKTKTL